MLKRLLLGLTGIALLAGCGGGGGSTPYVGGNANALPAGYTGNTAQATVTTSNAKALSVDAYGGVQSAGSLDVVGKAVADNTVPQPMVQEVVGVLDNAASAIAPDQGTAKSVASIASAQDTKYGYSGSYSYTIAIDTSSGVTTGSMTFSQYKEFSTSIVMNGTVAFSGVFNLTTSKFTSFSMTMTSVTASNGSASITMSGSISTSVSGSSKSFTTTMAITDNIAGTTMAMKNYAVTLTGNSLTISGTFYHPSHGYVTISTVTPLTVSSMSATPTAGQLLFTGSNGTKARLTFSTSGYTVEADTAGNGSYVVVP